LKGKLKPTEYILKGYVALGWRGKVKPTEYNLKGYVALEGKFETYQV